MGAIKKMAVSCVCAGVALSMSLPAVNNIVKAEGFTGPVNAEVSASTNEFPNASQQDMEIAKLISSNLETKVDENGQTHLVIADAESLMSQLSNSDSSIEVADVEQAVASFNQLLGSNSEISTFSTCNKALTFIGYVHAGSYAAAAALLGITGPAAVIVPLVIGLVYNAGALLC